MARKCREEAAQRHEPKFNRLAEHGMAQTLALHQRTKRAAKLSMRRQRSTEIRAKR